jgi:symplekin
MSSSNIMDEDPDYEQQNLSDDDNAQPDDDDDVANLLGGGTGGGGGGGGVGTGELGEDPLLLAVDDLEGRVVSSLDDVKMHPGVRTFAITNTTGGGGGGGGSVHDELATLLRPVLEVVAHTGPSVARTYFRGPTDGLSAGGGGLDDAVEEVYERLVSDLVLPVLLEMAQSDQIPAKRGAALEFFRLLWKETHKAGSWLDTTTANLSLAGPYGSGGGGSTSSHGGGTVNLPRAIQSRRQEKRLAREGEILRYWIQAAIACLTPGVFTAEQADLTAASRGILAASASLRPALQHIVQRIKAADDRGANRLYTPVMKMIENILNRLFLSNGQPAEALIASCIKFLEIVVLCCSRKPKELSSARGARRGGAAVRFIIVLLCLH